MKQTIALARTHKAANLLTLGIEKFLRKRMYKNTKFPILSNSKKIPNFFSDKT